VANLLRQSFTMSPTPIFLEDYLQAQPIIGNPEPIMASKLFVKLITVYYCYVFVLFSGKITNGKKQLQ
jgi:hypothetical protein